MSIESSRGSLPPGLQQCLLICGPPQPLTIETRQSMLEGLGVKHDCACKTLAFTSFDPEELHTGHPPPDPSIHLHILIVLSSPKSLRISTVVPPGRMILLRLSS